MTDRKTLKKLSELLYENARLRKALEDIEMLGGPVSRHLARKALDETITGKERRD